MLYNANMQIPDTIKIGAHEFYIHKRVMDEQCGNFDGSNLTITIDDTKPQSIQEETLIHETLHAILFLLGLDGDNKKEEHFVQSVGHLFYEVLKTNKLLK